MIDFKFKVKVFSRYQGDCRMASLDTGKIFHVSYNTYKKLEPKELKQNWEDRLSVRKRQHKTSRYLQNINRTKSYNRERYAAGGRHGTDYSHKVQLIFDKEI